ncbi:MAG: hypothetical protein ACI861_001011 [Paracoccaceae bacterium]|jgi:uncharacterized protein (TIGR02246 family)
MTESSEKIEKMAAEYSAAWSSGNAAAVASHYASDGRITINRGDAIVGTLAVTEMAAEFYSEFPDLVVKCDEIRSSGNHAIFIWTLEGHHSETKNFVSVPGWEEWELNDDLKVVSSLGWFDAEEYDRQIAEGI